VEKLKHLPEGKFPLWQLENLQKEKAYEYYFTYYPGFVINWGAAGLAV
jgi:hypothetical protein